MAFRKGELESTVEDLRNVGLLASMSNADLVKLAKLGVTVDATEGAIIIDQGDVGTECFLILEGEASVMIGGQHVVTVGPGSIVGEMALIDHRPRTASVVAETAMRLLSFDIAAFKRLLDEMPQARDHIFVLLRERAAENRSR